MRKIALLAVLFLAPSCAAVKGWLANGPEIELSAGVGPAKLALTLNPGKTLVSAADAVADAASAVVPSDSSIAPEPVAAPGK